MALKEVNVIAMHVCPTAGAVQVLLTPIFFLILLQVNLQHYMYMTEDHNPKYKLHYYIIVNLTCEHVLIG